MIYIANVLFASSIGFPKPREFGSQLCLNYLSDPFLVQLYDVFLFNLFIVSVHVIGIRNSLLQGIQEIFELLRCLQGGLTLYRIKNAVHHFDDKFYLLKSELDHVLYGHLLFDALHLLLKLHDFLIKLVTKDSAPFGG